MYHNYNFQRFYPQTGNRVILPRGQYNQDRGLLLPFLAGVLVTTPFIFLNKNQNQQPVGYYPPYYPSYPYPQYQVPVSPYPQYPLYR